MSERYPGGFITKDTPVTTQTSATGVWTLDQALQATRGGNWPVNGPYFIEDVFSTWLYTGNGGTQTINNGIDLAGKGGLVWTKSRTTTAWHEQTDTVRGASKYISSNATIAQQNSQPNHVTAFNSNGFSVGNETDVNANGVPFVSWTFREQPRFFDIVTWTGDGVSGRAIPHNLGSAPGFIAIKLLSSADNWECYHRGIPFNSANVLWLNSTNAVTTGGARFTSQPNATDFFVGSDSGVNGSGRTYVAYLFAHNAGGFGLSGNDNVISCGSFTDSATVSLGYEPQWIMVKRTNTTGDWYMVDTMRGLTANFSGSAAGDAELFANLSSAELAPPNGDIGINSTGFRWNGSAGTYIYIAIRRGPMKTPTTGTSVFAPVTQTAAGTVTTGFPVDLAISGSRTIAGSKLSLDRLRGSSTNSYASLFTNSTGAEGTGTGSGFGFDNNTGYVDAFWSSSSMAYWNFRRAPGFFDEVCYTGSGTTTTQTHNLQAVPELIIVKRRNGTAFWQVYSATYGRNFYAFLNDTQGFSSDPGNAWGTTDPTTTTFSLSPLTETNASGSTYVAYLFASVPGVSRVGSYTGTGTTQTINCGFAAGARFVMIKRADASGDWFVWDTARGMIPANDPYLRLNSTAAEVTGTDFVDTAATGFEITSTAPAAINASGGTFIYLAIA